jgi:glycosyltransferase involved in cell wall biosynthesis
MRGIDSSPYPTASPLQEGASALVVATILRPEGNTGVQTHVQQFRRQLAQDGTAVTIITPFSWGRALRVPVFGFRFALERVSGDANVAWYRYWHEAFLLNALRRFLGTAGDCVIYAQEPLAARAALRARRGPGQRVVMAVHFRKSQADEWAGKGLIAADGAVFRWIRGMERDTIPQLDGLVYVSTWARDALLEWLPEAAAVPSAVVENFVQPLEARHEVAPTADLATTGSLEPVKNHAYLLHVIAAAKRAGQTLTLDVFGEGPLRSDLSELAGRLGVDKQVRFRGFCSDVRDRLPGYRAYIHASRSEGCPLAVIEAMAAGLPVAAGDIGPIREMLDDGVEGRLLPLDDPAKAAAVLTGLLADENARRAAAKAAKARFDRSYDARVMVPRLLSFLTGDGPV